MKSIILSKKQEKILNEFLSKFEDLKKENISIVFDRDLSKFYAYSNLEVEEVYPKDEEKSIHKENEIKEIPLDIEDYNIRDLGFLIKMK